nr:hypothetical protein [Tanacetum cinerariifolium]
MAQLPITSEEELCPNNKRVAVSVSKLRINPDEIHVEPFFNLTMDTLKQPDQPFVKPRSQDELLTFIKKSGYADSLTSGAPTLRRGQGKGYLRKGGLQVIAPKKKTAKVPRRSRAIIVADNLLEDPDQAVDLANDDDKTKSDKDYDHGDNVDESDKDSDARDVQITGFRILVHDKELEQQPKPQTHSLNDPLENHEGEKKIKRQKGASGSSSKKEKAMADNSNFKRFKDADEPRQEHEEEVHHDTFKGERFHNDLTKPLPLVGPLGRKTIPTRYFNNDLEYWKYGNQEKKYAILVTKIKVARYKQEETEEMIPHLWSPRIY